VLGVGAAASTLAQSVVRTPVERALDVGTGCGIQALHLSRHSRSITATDLSQRALRMAATTAAVNGLTWDLRAGSLLEPVAAEQFDLIVSNPPFIVGPGSPLAPTASGIGTAVWRVTRSARP
jgi:methylase of polypeptide subunit release factors